MATAIKLNKYWEEIKLSKKDKDNYKKSFGVRAEKAYMMKDKYWKLLNELLT